MLRHILFDATPFFAPLDIVCCDMFFFFAMSPAAVVASSRRRRQRYFRYATLLMPAYFAFRTYAYTLFAAAFFHTSAATDAIRRCFRFSYADATFSRDSEHQRHHEYRSTGSTREYGKRERDNVLPRRATLLPCCCRIHARCFAATIIRRCHFFSRSGYAI